MRPRLETLLYLGLSLGLAVLLTIYVGSQHDRNVTRGGADAQQPATIGTFKGLISSKQETVTVPLQLSGVDTDAYFVTGAPETVAVTLTGAPGLVTAAQNTKNFQVYADLANLDEGAHEVTLKVSGLSSGLTYKLNPEVVHLNLYKRVVKNASVQVRYNQDALAKGYHAGKVMSSVSKVQLMGRQEAIDAVASVVANVQLPRDTKEDVIKEVTLQALDEQGNVIEVGISPQTTRVQIPVHAGKGSLKIPVAFKAKHGSLDDYTISSSMNEVTTYGKMKELEKLKTIPVTVDLADIHGETKQTIELSLPDGVSTDKPTITVTIKPKEN